MTLKANWMGAGLAGGLSPALQQPLAAPGSCTRSRQTVLPARVDCPPPSTMNLCVSPQV